MHALYDEKPRAGIVINLDQPGRVELAGIPGVQHILVAGFRGMAEVADVVGVGWRSGLIDLPRVPVAALARGLRTEVNPEAELGLAQPGRLSGIVFGDGIPGRLIGAGGDGKVHLDFRKGGRILHGDGVRRLEGGQAGNRRGLGHLLRLRREGCAEKKSEGERECATQGSHDLTRLTDRSSHLQPIHI